jgi:hypothetical protein
MTYKKSELRKKTADELSAMLADDSLFLSDDKNDDILLITEVLAKKEKKTAKEIKAEDEALWNKLAAKHGDLIPIKPKTRAESERITFKYVSRRVVAVAAAFALIILAGNTVTTFAYNENLFTVLFSFNDEVFKSDLVNPSGSNETPDKENTEYDFKTLEEAFKAFGISKPGVPVLPDGYVLRELDTRYFGGRFMVRGFYERGDDTLIIEATIYDQTPDSLQTFYEKDDGPVEVYKYAGQEINIFTNLTRRVAVWIDGAGEFAVSGELTPDEIKAIIHSMYD